MRVGLDVFNSLDTELKKGQVALQREKRINVKLMFVPLYVQFWIENTDG